MAKSRKPQGFVDPLDSIFGVIFGNAKSKPVRIKPRKINGKNTNEMLVAGLAEIAAKPANYVSDSIFGALKETGNVNLVEFNLDKFDDSISGGDNSAGRFRLRGSEAAAFMTNPNKFIDSVFEKAKAERKWSNYMNIGRGMDSALMTVWAKKNGFSNKESLTIGMASSNFLGPDQVNQARRKFSENVVLASINGRRKDASDPSFIDINTARAVSKALDEAKSFDLKRDPNRLEAVLKTVPGLSSRADFNDIVKDIREQYKKHLNDDYGGLLGGKYISDGKINRAGYVSAIRQNYQQRMALLDVNDPKAKAEYIRMAEANNALDVMMRLKGPNFGSKNADDTIEMLDSTLKNIKKDLGLEKDPSRILALKKQADELERGIKDVTKKRDIFKTLLPWGNTLSGDFSKYKRAMLGDIDYQIQKAEWKFNSASPKDKDQLLMNLDLLKRQKESLRTMSGIEWRVLLGDINGTYQTIKGNIVDGGIAANVINGTFFMQPVTGSMAPGTFGGVEYLKGKNQNFNANIVVPRGDISDGYAALAHLYYLTPGSIAKTFFFNGEGFGYLKYIQRMRVANALNEKGVGNTLFASLSSMDADTQKALKGFFVAGADGITHKLNEQAFASNYISLMDQLGANSGKLGGIWGDLEKLYSKDQKSFLTAIMRVTGAPQRMVKEFDLLYQKYVKNKVNTFFVNTVVSRFFGKEATSKILEIGIAKLGIRQMISIGVSEWLAGIGATVGGPIGAIAGFLLTQLAEGFIDKLIRPFIKMFFGALWFIMIIIIALIGVVFMFIYDVTHPKPLAHIPPTDALECAAGNPFADLYKFETQDDGNNLPDPDPNSTCPFHGTGYYCTQGDEAGSSAYHQARNSMDIGTRGVSSPIWYAPADGNVVKFTAVNYCLDGANYGGAMIFKDGAGVEYHILHVQALASGSVKKGQPVAIVQTDLNSSWCWTGPHFHLDVKVGGGFVDDTQHWYTEKLKCNIASNDGTCR